MTTNGQMGTTACGIGRSDVVGDAFDSLSTHILVLYILMFINARVKCLNEIMTAMSASPTFLFVDAHIHIHTHHTLVY